MDDFVKSILMILVILYALSPIDAFPEPIDDLILLFIVLSKRKKDDNN